LASAFKIRKTIKHFEQGQNASHGRHRSWPVESKEIEIGSIGKFKGLKPHIADELRNLEQGRLTHSSKPCQPLLPRQRIFSFDDPGLKWILRGTSFTLVAIWKF